MPRFFLHISNGDGLTMDEEGLELPHLDAAIHQAKESIRSIVAEEARSGRLHLHGVIHIEQPLGSRRYTVAFEDAFEPAREAGDLRD